MSKILVLKNNLRLVYNKMENVRSVAIGIFVNTGSINENQYQKGIAHFIEHILFKGTKKRNAFEIAETMESKGVNINAYTSKLITAYYTISTDEHKDVCFDILSDIFFNSTMTKENLKKEKNVILEEINMCEDDPEDLCFEQLSFAHYGDNNCSSPILGYAESVNSFEKKDCDKYMRDYYTADNTVISVAGNFEEEDLIALVKKYFEEKFSDKKAKEPKEIYAKPKGRFFKKIKPIEQANVAIALKAFPYGQKRQPALLLATNLLGGGMSSRLFQKIREDLGIVYTIYSTVMQYRKNGQFCIFFATNPSTVELAIKEIKKELITFVKKGITEKELNKGKEQLKSNLVLGVESASAVMRQNGRNVLMENESFDIDKKLEEINAVTIEDVNAVINELFTSKDASISYVGKEIDIDLLEIFNKKG